MAESTAAAVAYGLFVAGTKNVLVFDCGGGTTDLTLLRVCEGQFEVLATCGNNALGGEDLDSKLAAYAVQKAGLSGERTKDGTTTVTATETSQTRSKEDGGKDGDDGGNNAADSAATAAGADATSNASTTATSTSDATTESWVGNNALRAAVAAARVELSTSTSAKVECTLHRRRRYDLSSSSSSSPSSAIPLAAAAAPAAASVSNNKGDHEQEEEEEEELVQVSVEVNRDEFEEKVAASFLEGVQSLLTEVLAQHSAQEVSTCKSSLFSNARIQLLL